MTFFFFFNFSIAILGSRYDTRIAGPSIAMHRCIVTPLCYSTTVAPPGGGGYTNSRFLRFVVRSAPLFRSLILTQPYSRISVYSETLPYGYLTSKVVTSPLWSPLLRQLSPYLYSTVQVSPLVHSHFTEFTPCQTCNI